MKKEDIEKEYKPHNIPIRMGMKPPTDKDKAGRRSQRMHGSDGGGGEDCPSSEQTIKKEEDIEGEVIDSKTGETKFAGTNSFSKELARLQFFGAGPKMAGLPSEKSKSDKTRGVKINFEYDPVRK